MINRSKLVNRKRIGYEKVVVHREAGIREDFNENLQIHLFINYEVNCRMKNKPSTLKLRASINSHETRKWIMKTKYIIMKTNVGSTSSGLIDLG